MQAKLWMVVLRTYLIAWIGGFLFSKAGFPLPWILGPVAIVIIWKSFFNIDLRCPGSLRDSGFTILGIYFGLNFTLTTVLTVFPYIIPYSIMTVLLVTISIVNSTFISRFIEVDQATSVFGSIPGGLSEMAAASESLRANVAMVTILQTVRLLTVVFFVPFIVVHMFTSEVVSLFSAKDTLGDSNYFKYLWFSISAVAGWILKGRIPANFVIGPLLVTAVMSIAGIPLLHLPSFIIIFAQISVGMYMGNSISIKDLKLGGKYCGIYAALTLILIAASFGLGFIMTLITSLSLPTAMLSVAPGGIVEMGLTAASVGADPSVVSSLQLVRLLIIILFVPSILKWWFSRKAKHARVEPKKV